MKRLDINITNRLDIVLEALKRETETSKTELIHDAVALLHWTYQVYRKGHAVAEVDPNTGTVLTIFAMPRFERAAPLEETIPETQEVGAETGKLGLPV